MERKKPTNYSEKFKATVVNDVLLGKYTKEEARRLYGIKAKCAVLYWMRKFNGEKNYRQPMNENTKFELMNANKELQELKEKVARLEEEKRIAELKADLYNTMIDVAESKLGIVIRKKSRAQRLKP
jgi:transposase-like protein